MAASTSSSSAAPEEYDVFISCRGEDTRYDFTSHLVDALSRNSIRAYVDYELKKEDEISASLIKAIHDSYGSVIVFSENYASSKWCLNELLQILECRKQGHFVIPVFYNIDPSCVREQTESYGQAFAIHEQDSRNKEQLQSWKAALTEATNIARWHTRSPANRDEFKLIGNIVDDILEKMDHIYQIKESRFVGIDRCCKDIESLLKRFSMVGIWGMGGVGKTTIAKVVFNKLCCQYKSSYFFENLREQSEENIRAKLPYELLKNENIGNSKKAHPCAHPCARWTPSERVLIVLDDVDNFEQLEFLQKGCNYLKLGIEVIITTRDKYLVSGFRYFSTAYEVQELDFEKSLQLFRLYAFNESYPETGYEEITKKFVDYGRGIPLALKVLGCFLHSKSKGEWASALEKLNKIPNDDISNVLRLSYDGLDYSEQQIFLDIACFLKGEHIEDVISFLDSCGFYGRNGIRSLQDKALVTTTYRGVVQMHDLMQDMGRHIVHGVSVNSPGECSRLWDLKEIHHVLKNNKGTDRIEAITLDISKTEDLPLKTDAFKKMTNLRLLNFYASNYATATAKEKSSRCLELSSDKLSFFCWVGFPFHSLSSNFCAKKLVVLCMPFGKMSKLWDGLQDVVNLKELILYECRQLMVLPDLSNASKLERVDLSGCAKLSQLPDNISALSSLNKLTLTKSGVKSLPTSIKHLPCLKHLDVSHCQRLRSLPELPPSTIDLDARSCQILKTLIPSTRLEQCYLEDCVKLDQQSIDGVMAAMSYRIKQAEPSRVGLPGERVPRWLRYCTKQDRISIELPPRSDLLGFAFYCTVSCTIIAVAGACFLEDGAGMEYTGKWVGTYEPKSEGNWVGTYKRESEGKWARTYRPESEYEWVGTHKPESEGKWVGKPKYFINKHTYLWYDRRISDSLNAMEGRTHGEVSFRLIAANAFGIRLGGLRFLEAFGVRPIYASELELGDERKTELEVDNQLQLSLTKKFKNILRNLF